MAKAAHQHLGDLGESVAARMLEGRGFRIVARNWRPAGRQAGVELDLVARHKEYLVFVEVKTRSCAAKGGLVVPVYAAFTPQKQTKLVRAANLYLDENNAWDTPCRFDLVCVEYIADSAQGSGAACSDFCMPPRNGAFGEASNSGTLGSSVFHIIQGSMKLEHYTHVIELGQTLDSGHATWQPW